MAMRKSNSPKYWAPAKFNILDGDGVLQVNLFDLEFKRHDKDQLKELDEFIRTFKLPKDAPKGTVLGEARNRAVLARVATNWRAVEDATGAALPYSLEEADRMEICHPGFINACVTAFYLSTDPKESAHLAAKN